jgi:predicted kinase
MGDDGEWKEVPARTKKQQRRQQLEQQRERHPPQQGGTRHGGGPRVEPPALVPRLQTVIVLVGTPGCGKSTFCRALDARLASSPGMPTPIRVSQDDLGNRKACEALAEAALRVGHNVVIDRCNFDEAQRATWLKIGRRHGCAVVAAFLNTPNSVCKQRVMSRADHPTLGPTRQSMQIVERFRSMLRPPKEQEGFCLVVEAAADMPSVEAAAAALADHLFSAMAPAPAEEEAGASVAVEAGAPLGHRSFSTVAMEGLLMEGLLLEPWISAPQRAALAATLGSSSGGSTDVHSLQRTALQEEQARLDGDLRALNRLKAATGSAITPEFDGGWGHVTEPESGDAFVLPLQDSGSETALVLLHETCGEINRLRAELGLPAGLAALGSGTLAVAGGGAAVAYGQGSDSGGGGGRMRPDAPAWQPSGQPNQSNE